MSTKENARWQAGEEGSSCRNSTIARWACDALVLHWALARAYAGWAGATLAQHIRRIGGSQRGRRRL